MEELTNLERIIKQCQEYGRIIDSIQLTWEKFTLKSKSSGQDYTGNKNNNSETEVLKPILFIKYK